MKNLLLYHILVYLDCHEQQQNSKKSKKKIVKGQPKFEK